MWWVPCFFSVDHLHPLWFVSATPSLFDAIPASNDVQTTSQAFLQPLLPCCAAPLICFTHPHLLDIQMMFPPPLLVSPTTSLFDAIMASNDLQMTLQAFLHPLLLCFATPLLCFTHPIHVWCRYGVKQCSNGLAHIPPPLLPCSAVPLLYFTHLPLFNVQTTFPPPLIWFAHPIPIWHSYGIKWRSNGLPGIPPSLLSCYGTLLLCFMHLPLFNIPMTFPPPHFSHP